VLDLEFERHLRDFRVPGQRDRVVDGRHDEEALEPRELLIVAGHPAELAGNQEVFGSATEYVLALGRLHHHDGLGLRRADRAAAA
jgi:hypothetical protein